MDISERIKFYREKIGISQTELAKLVGVSREAVSQWEKPFDIKKGKKPTRPNGQNVIKLAEIFSISPHLLQFGEELKETTVSQSASNSGKFKNIPMPEMSQISKWIANPVIDETYKVHKIYLGEDVGDAVFLYEVTSNAMINLREVDKSIFPGEIAVIDPTIKPNPGEFVLAEYAPEDYRIRRYEQDGKTEYLEAYNALPIDQKTLVDDKTKIMGVVLTTFRDRRIPQK